MALEGVYSGHTGYVRTEYTNLFGTSPDFLVHAPGRINLIGEHTDYNLGHVLPGAIPEGVYFAIGQNGTGTHRWTALDVAESVAITTTQETPKSGSWSDYLLGACHEMDLPLQEIPAFNCVFSANLPVGAGLSSSSALTCGILTALRYMLGVNIPDDMLAWKAYRVEREFVGLKGGIMDQYASILGRKDNLLLLDCRDRTFRHIPFDQKERSLFLINTNVPRRLTASQYNTRTEECARAVELLCKTLPISSLRDVRVSDLKTHLATLTPLLRKRADFVVRENARVLEAAKCLQRRDFTSLGTLLYQSHDGLQNDYEVSCPELDFLVSLTRDADWIDGARMMGGGFGGCTINLASRSPDLEFTAHVHDAYTRQFGFAPTFIPVTLASGARVIDAD